jgi:aerobic-type carbon monoxide dehydrogenase small subunit (CoxS/CutS family)
VIPAIASFDIFELTSRPAGPNFAGSQERGHRAKPRTVSWPVTSAHLLRVRTMPRYDLTLNGKMHTIEAAHDMPLLWALRDVAGLTGTKFGCGAGVCGACTVLDGRDPVRSCQITVSAAAGRSFTTIEGLAGAGGRLVQDAWIEADVSHCGYCQAGMLLAATALLERDPHPSDAAIDEALSAHLCRCGSYPRIRSAIRLAAVWRAAARREAAR